MKVSGAVAGYTREAPSRGAAEDSNAIQHNSSINQFEEVKGGAATGLDYHTNSMPGGIGMMTNQSNFMNESNDPSMLAVPEHHIRE